MSILVTTAAQAGARPRQILVLVAAAATILSLSMGLRQSLGLFLGPVTADLGVSASIFGFAMALQNLVWGVSQPFVGMLADRYGARRVLIPGAGVYVAGLLLMATSQQPAIGLQLGGGILIGLGVASTAFGVLLGAVARAVPPAERSRKVGIVAAAGSLGTLVLAPLGQGLIDGVGWRTAILVFAGIGALMALIAIAIGGGSAAAAEPGETHRSLGEALQDALGHGGFLAMTAAFFACGFQLVFITIHLPKYLAICGLQPGVGASALGLIGLGNAAGSYIVGVLGQRYSQKRLLALIYLLRTAAIVVFLTLPITPLSTLVFAAAMGLLWLSVVPLVTGLIGRMFGLQHLNMLFGFMFFSHQLGSFAGAWMGGLVFDLSGSYEIAWAALIAIGLAATALQWPMDDRPPVRDGRLGTVAA